MSQLTGSMPGGKATHFFRFFRIEAMYFFAAAEPLTMRAAFFELEARFARFFVEVPAFFARFRLRVVRVAP
jgi:hypothetical protein